MGTSEGRGRERRKSYRYPVVPGQQEAELRAGGQPWSVLLLDESSGGFAVWLDQDPGVSVGQTAELRTASGDFLVSVSHVDKGDLTPAEGSGMFRLGLQRVRMLNALQSKPDRDWDIAPRHGVWRLFPASISRAALGALASAVLAIALAVGLAFLVSWNHPLARYFYDW